MKILAKYDVHTKSQLVDKTITSYHKTILFFNLVILNASGFMASMNMYSFLCDLIQTKENPMGKTNLFDTLAVY